MVRGDKESNHIESEEWGTFASRNMNWTMDCIASLKGFVPSVAAADYCLLGCNAL
jgi:hypothetical protein